MEDSAIVCCERLVRSFCLVNVSWAKSLVATFLGARACYSGLRRLVEFGTGREANGPGSLESFKSTVCRRYIWSS